MCMDTLLKPVTVLAFVKRIDSSSIILKLHMNHIVKFEPIREKRSHVCLVTVIILTLDTVNTSVGSINFCLVLAVEQTCGCVM